MRGFTIIAAGAVALGMSGVVDVTVAAQPAEVAVRVQTAKFAIANMTCATCPITVKAAMRSVKGVRSVDVDFKAKTAIVAFDPALASLAQIAAASTNAGYPAKATR
jgi:mercuric ion binding protein